MSTVENNNGGTVDQVDGDRGLPSVNDRQPTSVKKGLAVMFMAGVALLGAGLLYFWLIRGKQADADKPVPKAAQLQASVPQRTFELPPPPPPADQDVRPIALDNSGQGQPVPQVGPGGASATPPKPRPRLDKGSAGLMVTGGDSGASGASAAAPAAAGAGVGPYAYPTPEQPAGGAGNAPGGGAGPLGSLLTSASTPMASAGKLGDRNMTLAKGSFIDCVLQTRIDSTLPGMTACVVTRNIFSDNGKVLLIERGSVVTGEYQSALKEGQNRLFVLWTRIKTPNGVVISLDSPGTDSLGGAGLGGHVNYHFWKRFGAAMLLSMIDDGFAAIAANQSGGGDSYYYGNTSAAATDMAGKTLDSTIKIPPTLYKNQGERINIFVARDLNFGAVYGLRAR